MKTILLISLLISINAIGQTTFRIDSVGQKRGQSLELFSGDTLYLYRWRGMGKPMVKAGMIATINPPNKRLKRYYLTL